MKTFLMLIVPALLLACGCSHKPIERSIQSKLELTSESKSCVIYSPGIANEQGWIFPSNFLDLTIGFREHSEKTSELLIWWLSDHGTNIQPWYDANVWRDEQGLFHLNLGTIRIQKDGRIIGYSKSY